MTSSLGDTGRSFAITVTHLRSKESLKLRFESPPCCSFSCMDQPLVMPVMRQPSVHSAGHGGCRTALDPRESSVSGTQPEALGPIPCSSAACPCWSRGQVWLQRLWRRRRIRDLDSRWPNVFARADLPPGAAVLPSPLLCCNMLTPALYPPPPSAETNDYGCTILPQELSTVCGTGHCSHSAATSRSCYYSCCHQSDAMQGHSIHTVDSNEIAPVALLRPETFSVTPKTAGPPSPDAVVVDVPSNWSPPAPREPLPAVPASPDSVSAVTSSKVASHGSVSAGVFTLQAFGGHSPALSSMELPEHHTGAPQQRGGLSRDAVGTETHSAADCGGASGADDTRQAPVEYPESAEHTGAAVAAALAQLQRGASLRSRLAVASGVGAPVQRPALQAPARLLVACDCPRNDTQCRPPRLPPGPPLQAAVSACGGVA